MSSRFHAVALTLVATMLLAGCGEEDVNSRYELAAKPEYSVLQSFEFRYRNHEHSEKYIVQRNALDTQFDVFALPAKGQNKGYVWFVANPKVPPFVKIMPDDVEFVVEKEVVEAIDHSVRLAPVVKAYLVDRSR